MRLKKLRMVQKHSRKRLSNNYDCILLDHMMPEKDGLEVLQELREQKNIDTGYYVNGER